MLYNQQPYTDHLGNIFASEKELLTHYNIAKTTYYRQLKNGKSIEEIITNYQKRPPVHDHNGQTFNNIAEMLKYHNVSESVYRYGLKNNIPVETILTKQRHRSTDHLGNEFKTFKEMCEYWNISVNSVKRRLKENWTLERALTEPMHRPLSLPKILKHPNVMTTITHISHINNNYFLCTIENHDVIMTRQNLIKYAQSLLPERT